MSIPSAISNEPKPASLTQRAVFYAARLFPWLLALAGLAGVALVLYLTRWGAGLMDDAFIYLTSAENFAAGKGLTWPWGDGSLRPMTYFPPLFPLLLALGEKLGLPAVAGARYLNALAFGANVVLAGELARRASRSAILGLLASLLVLTSDVLMEDHAWALSEALYILLALSGMLLLSQAGLGRNLLSRRWLALSGIILGLGFLTRYIGFSLVLAGLAALLLEAQRPLRKRVEEVALFGAFSLAPIALWMLRTRLVIGTAIDRSADVHLMTIKQFAKAANTLLIWFVPGRLVHGREFLVLGLLAVALAALVLWLRRGAVTSTADATDMRASSALRRLLAFQAVLHFFVLWVSKSFFEPTTPLNDRILSPMLPALLILLVALLADLWRTGHTTWRRPFQVAVLVIALAFAGFYALRTTALAPRLHNQGIGLARKGWRQSDTLTALRQMPAGPIFSNSPAAIYLWTERPAYPIWDAEFMRQSLQEQDGVLVVFNSVSLDLYDTSLESLTAGLTSVGEFRDGAIYKIR